AQSSSADKAIELLRLSLQCPLPATIFANESDRCSKTTELRTNKYEGDEQTLSVTATNERRTHNCHDNSLEEANVSHRYRASIAAFGKVEKNGSSVVLRCSSGANCVELLVEGKDCTPYVSGFPTHCRDAGRGKVEQHAAMAIKLCDENAASDAEA